MSRTIYGILYACTHEGWVWRLILLVRPAKCESLTSLASSPGPLRGRRRKGLVHTVCACANLIFLKNVRKNLRTLSPTTCWQVKRSICLQNAEWPSDLRTSARAKCTPILFGVLRWSIWQSPLSSLEISLKNRTVHIKMFEDIACFYHYLAPLMSTEICIRKLYFGLYLSDITI